MARGAGGGGEGRIVFHVDDELHRERTTSMKHLVLVTAAIGVLLEPFSLWHRSEADAAGRYTKVRTALASVPAAQSSRSRLAHLGGVAELEAWFNAGQGHPRLILLLSPT